MLWYFSNVTKDKGANLIIIKEGKISRHHNFYFYLSLSLPRSYCCSVIFHCLLSVPNRLLYRFLWRIQDVSHCSMSAVLQDIPQTLVTFRLRKFSKLNFLFKSYVLFTQNYRTGTILVLSPVHKCRNYDSRQTKCRKQTKHFQVFCI